jgi:NADH-quinone oxidoreductase subunit J
LTLREKRESKSMDPSEQVLVKKADRIRIIKMDAVKEELPAEPQPIDPKFKEHK